MYNYVQYTYLFLFSTYFGHPCAHHQEKFTVSMWHCFHSVWVASSLMVRFRIQPADQTPLIHNNKYKCRMDTVSFSWWWAHGCPKHVEKRNKYTKKNCEPSWIHLQDVVITYASTQDCIYCSFHDTCNISSTRSDPVSMIISHWITLHKAVYKLSIYEVSHNSRRQKSDMRFAKVQSCAA